MKKILVLIMILGLVLTGAPAEIRELQPRRYLPTYLTMPGIKRIWSTLPTTPEG